MQMLVSSATRCGWNDLFDGLDACDNQNRKKEYRIEIKLLSSSALLRLTLASVLKWDVKLRIWRMGSSGLERLVDHPRTTVPAAGQFQIPRTPQAPKHGSHFHSLGRRLGGLTVDVHSFLAALVHSHSAVPYDLQTLVLSAHLGRCFGPGG